MFECVCVWVCNPKEISFVEGGFKMKGLNHGMATPLQAPLPKVIAVVVPPGVSCSPGCQRSAPLSTLLLDRSGTPV